MVSTPARMPTRGGGRRARRTRRGFTLLEVLVVLLLLGLAFALVSPLVVSPRNTQDDVVQRLIDEARREAVRRAATVTLSIHANGDWTMESRDPLAAPLKRGALAASGQVPMRVLVSALGACTLETPAAPQVAAVDPVRCRLSR